jgi:hypothetical protein
MRVKSDIHENFFENAPPVEERRLEIVETELFRYIRNRGKVIEKEFASKQAFKIDLNHPKMLNALVDAFFDIRRIEDFHNLNDGPSQVKLAANIAFWFLRWQPCSILPQEDFLSSPNLTLKEKKKLLLINENLMVTYLLANVFVGSEGICAAAPLKSSLEWEGYYEYLFYYLVYRLRSPKELEAVLKTVTLHPLWRVQQDISFMNKDRKHEMDK